MPIYLSFLSIYRSPKALCGQNGTTDAILKVRSLENKTNHAYIQLLVNRHPPTTMCTSLIFTATMQECGHTQDMSQLTPCQDATQRRSWCPEENWTWSRSEEDIHQPGFCGRCQGQDSGPQGGIEGARELRPVQEAVVHYQGSEFESDDDYDENCEHCWQEHLSECRQCRGMERQRRRARRRHGRRQRLLAMLRRGGWVR